MSIQKSTYEPFIVTTWLVDWRTTHSQEVTYHIQCRHNLKCTDYKRITHNMNAGPSKLLLLCYIRAISRYLLHFTYTMYVQIYLRTSYTIELQILPCKVQNVKFTNKMILFFFESKSRIFVLSKQTIVLDPSQVMADWDKKQQTQNKKITVSFLYNNKSWQKYTQNTRDTFIINLMVNCYLLRKKIYLVNKHASTKNTWQWKCYLLTYEIKTLNLSFSLHTCIHLSSLI